MDNCPTMTLDFVTSACIFNIVETRIFIVCPETIVAIERVYHMLAAIGTCAFRQGGMLE